MLNRLIRINPKYKSSGTTSDFTMSFDTQDLQQVRACSLISATLNRTFPNIYSPLNRFIVRWLDGADVITDVRVAVPPGQYTVSTLAAALQTTIQAVGAIFAGITVTFNTVTSRFQFNWNGAGGAAQIHLVPLGLTLSTTANPETELAPYIGLTSFAVLAPSTPLDVASPPSLEGPDEVYIESQFICGSQCIDVPALGSSIPYLGKISFAGVPYGFTGTYQSTQAELQQINYRKEGVRNLSSFDIKLTDRYGNVIPTPANCFLDAHLCVFHT